MHAQRHTHIYAYYCGHLWNVLFYQESEKFSLLWYRETQADSALSIPPRRPTDRHRLSKPAPFQGPWQLWTREIIGAINKNVNPIRLFQMWDI